MTEQPEPDPATVEEPGAYPRRPLDESYPEVPTDTEAEPEPATDPESTDDPATEEEP